jgi:predicted ferric reductase
MQLAGLIFLWFHYQTSRPYVGISLAVFLIDRLVFRFWLKTTSHPATLTVLEDNETLLLSANWSISDRKAAFMPKNMKDGWKPNDHAFISIPTLSRKHTIQAHPFTIFSAAPTTTYNDQNDHAWFTLLIRAQAASGFTRTLLEYAQTHSQTRIRLDGPYGSPHALDMLSSSDTAIVVAGGSGIAVAYPLLYSLLRPSSTDLENPGRRTAKKVKLFWILHSASHREWVPQDKMKELQDWGLQLFVPPPTATAGRPDVTSTLKNWSDGGGMTGVVVSGPDGLVRDVRNTCAGFIAEGEDVRVQAEKFGW